MYLDTPLQRYLDDLASGEPAPGGGSAAALTGSLAASLACMVSHLTLKNDAYANVHEEFQTLLQQAEGLRAHFQELMQEDIEAYGRLSACYKMSRSTAEEKAARTQAIQSRLGEAAQVPLTIIEEAGELLTLAVRIAEIGNQNVLSDIATSAVLAQSAAQGAAWIVDVNLRYMKNEEAVVEMSGRMKIALERVTIDSQRVLARAGERS